MLKIVLIVSLLLSPAAGRGLLYAQNETNIPQPAAEALAQEPPLGQADVDAYLKIIPELADLLYAPQNAEKLAASLNISQARFSYVIVKTPLALALASGADPKALGLDSLPQALRPSEEELALIRKNLEALSLAAAAADKALAAAGPGR